DVPPPLIAPLPMVMLLVMYFCTSSLTDTTHAGEALISVNARSSPDRPLDQPRIDAAGCCRPKAVVLSRGRGLAWNLRHMSSSQPSLLPNATRELAAFAAATSFEQVPTEVIERIKLSLLDGLGVCLQGSTLPWTRLVQEVVDDEGGKPVASIFG